MDPAPRHRSRRSRSGRWGQPGVRQIQQRAEDAAADDVDAEHPRQRGAERREVGRGTRGDDLAELRARRLHVGRRLVERGALEDASGHPLVRTALLRLRGGAPPVRRCPPHRGTRRESSSRRRRRQAGDDGCALLGDGLVVGAVRVDQPAQRPGFAAGQRAGRRALLGQRVAPKQPALVGKLGPVGVGQSVPVRKLLDAPPFLPRGSRAAVETATPQLAARAPATPPPPCLSGRRPPIYWLRAGSRQTGGSNRAAPHSRPRDWNTRRCRVPRRG